MRNSFLKLLTAVLFLTAVTPAFAEDGGQLFGTLLGASVGGLIGGSLVHGHDHGLATGTGVVVGGYVGSELSRPSYPRYTSRPTYYYSYDMYPPPGYYVPYQPTYVAPPSPPPAPPVTYIDEDSGSYCREYSKTIRIGDRVQESYGTACLQPDGSWHIVQ